MESILANFGQLLTQNLWLAFVMALVAGLISSFSPCVLSAIPLVIGYVGGYAGDNPKTALKYSLLFCAGLAATFTALGVVSAVLGRLMMGAGGWWFILLGLIMTATGLQMLGILNFMPQVCGVPGRGKGLLGAFLLGILGGALSSPCATPVLVAILTFVAVKGNLMLGVGLLAFYSIGHCALLLIAGTSVGFVQNVASSSGAARWGRILKLFFGIFIIILALYLFYLGF
jgi:cytochrome c biogenesis protein CcdA